MPYFMIANYYLENETNLAEAIDLCKRGIGVAPKEESALLGYQTLLRLFVKTGDKTSFDEYSRQANELLRSFDQQN
jgi:two-component SAPR family response regulator